MTEIIKYFDSTGDGYGYQIAWANDQYHVNAKVREAVAVGDDPEDTEYSGVFVEIDVKWDGCVNIHFPEPILHWCGDEGWDKFIALLSHVREEAKLLSGWAEK